MSAPHAPRTICGLVAALAATPALAGGSELPVTFPESTRPDAVAAWLERETDITPKHVISINSAALLAFMQVRQISDAPTYEMTLRGEILTQTLYDREHFLSWHMPIEIDCPRHKIREGQAVAYRGRNLLDQARVVHPPMKAWEEPPVGVGLESAWRAVCDPTFRWPLAQNPSIAVLPKTAAKPSAVVPPDAGLRPERKVEANKAAETKARDRAASRPARPPKPAPPQPAGAISVQVGAGSSQAAAEEILRRARAHVAGPAASLRPRVERATVGGKLYFRAILDGFADVAAARAFCVKVQASGGDCFVRPSGGQAPAARPAAGQPSPSKK